MLALTGCAQNNSASESTTSTKDTASGDKVQISFWHSMSGANQEVLDGIVADFNASQD